jgi:hypothetical protein
VRHRSMSRALVGRLGWAGAWSCNAVGNDVSAFGGFS